MSVLKKISKKSKMFSMLKKHWAALQAQEGLPFEIDQELVKENRRKEKNRRKALKRKAKKS